MFKNMTIRSVKYRLLAFLIILLSGCSGDYENIFDESADERVRKALEANRAALLSAENGWKANLVTGLGLEFVFYFDFHEDGSVTMISDFDTVTAGVPMNGTYVMKALQRPTLSFDTYSYIHYLTDPDASVNGGILGEGLVSDFEFAFDNIEGDELDMEGIQRSTQMTMVKATTQEKATFLSGALKQSLINSYNFVEDNYYSSVDLGGGVVLYTGINLFTKTFTAIYITQNSTFEIVSIPFTYTADGIQLSGTFSLGNISFNKLVWINAQQTYSVTIGGSTFFFAGSNTPIIPAGINPALINALGSVYSTITIDPSLINGMSQEFLDLFEDVDQNVETAYGVNLSQVTITFNSGATQAIITYDLVFGAQIFPIDYLFSVTKNSGSMTFNNISAPRTIDQHILPLNTYFDSYTFTLDYVPDGNAASLLARMYPQENGYFCYGTLE